MTDMESLVRELTRRIKQLEDKEALAALMNRYCRAADAMDWQAWGQCWAEDADFEFGPFGVHKGREKIRDVVAAAEAPYAAMQHCILNMQFEVDGDRATGTANCWFVGVGDSAAPGTHYDMGGPYQWEFVRTTNGWRIQRLKLGVTWTLGEDTQRVFQSHSSGATTVTSSVNSLDITRSRSSTS